MDIEKLIERLKAKDFERDYDCTPFECGVFGLLDDAATALSTFQAENERLKNKLSELAHLPFDKPGIGERTKLMVENAELRAELEQVKRERDVAIEQLHGHCPACAHYTPNHNEGLCRFCCFEIAQDTNVEINDNWKWRGPKEV
jgi:hypothetical protein